MVLNENQLIALQETTRVITSELDLDRALNLIVTKGSELTRADIGSICLIDNTQKDQKMWFKILFGPDPKKIYSHSIDEGITGWVARNRKAIIIPDVHRNNCYVEYVKETKSELAVPIIYRDNLIGVLNVESSKLNKFTENDREVLSALADYAAIAIENARLYRDINKQIKVLEGLHKIGARITPNLELNPVLREITKGLNELIEVDIPLIYLYNQEKPEFIDSVYGDISTFWEKKCRPRHDGAGARAIRENKIIIAYEGSEPDINPFPKQKGVKTTASIPLTIKDSILGVMYLHFLGEKHIVSDKEKKELYKFSSEVSNILKKNLLKDISFLDSNDITENFREEITKDFEHRRLIEKLDRIVKADIILIYLYDDNIEELMKLCYSNISKGWENKSRPRQDGVGARAIEKKTMIVAYETTIPDINPAHRKKGVKTTAAIPLTLGEKVLGLMYMHFLLNERLFTNEEKKAINAFATNAAIAIETAKSYRDLRILCDIGKEITADINLKEVAADIAKGIEVVAGGGIPNIFLYDSATNSWEFLACSGAPEELFLGRFAPRKEGVGSNVVNTGKPIIIENVQKDDRASPTARRLNIQTTAAFPLMFKARALGVLFLHFKVKHHFTEDDILKLSMFAGKAAIAIENARRYKALEKTRNEAEAAQAVAWLGITSSTFRHTLVQKIFSIETEIATLETLETSKFSNEGRDILKKIKDSLQLIKRIEPEFPEDYLEMNIDVSTLIQTSIKKHESKIKVKGINLHIDIDQYIPPIRANEGWLSVVMDILIDNALRAMADGGDLTFICKVAGDRLQLEITDTSCLPTSIADQIFRRRVEGTQGFGVGLLLAKTILRRYGGDIKLSSTSPCETSFIICFPIKNQEVRN